MLLCPQAFPQGPMDLHGAFAKGDIQAYSRQVDLLTENDRSGIWLSKAHGDEDRHHLQRLPQQA